MKIPLFIEVFGETAVGKSHFAASMPRPLIIDTTPKAESYVPARKVLGGEINGRWFHCRSLKQVRITLEQNLRRDDVATVVFDTSTDLVQLAKEEWLKEKGRERPLPFEYAEIYSKVDELINKVFEAKKNLVFTAIMKDEYIETVEGTKKTGRRVRSGYVKSPFMVDILIKISLVQKGDKIERIYKVLKNRFRDMTGDEWISQLDVSEGLWKGIVKLTGYSEEELVT